MAFWINLHGCQHTIIKCFVLKAQHSKMKHLRDYSQVSIIRPGRSRLLEFEKSTGRLIEIFFQISRHGRFIEPKNLPWQPFNKTVQLFFSEMDLVV